MSPSFYCDILAPYTMMVANTLRVPISFYRIRIWSAITLPFQVNGALLVIRLTVTAGKSKQIPFHE